MMLFSLNLCFQNESVEKRETCLEATFHLISLRLVEVDDFIASLWNVHLSVKEEGYVQVAQSTPEWYNTWMLMVNPSPCP